MKYSPKRELKRFLDEDVAKGDITSKLLKKQKIVARIITREQTVVAGTKHAKEIFALKKCRTKILKQDGKIAKPNQTILEIIGNAGDVLTCERTALNLLSRMCGIATQTNNLKKLVKSTGSKSSDCRASSKLAASARFWTIAPILLTPLFALSRYLLLLTSS